MAGASGAMFHYRALSGGPAGTVVALTALYPVVTTLLAIPVLGEPLTANRATGLALAVLAGFFLTR